MIKNSFTAASSSGVRMSKDTERGGNAGFGGAEGGAPFVVALSDCWYARLLRRAAMSIHSDENGKSFAQEITYEDHKQDSHGAS